jgi:thiazole/oxazole-forming peptide maturase SagD family component
MQVSIAAAGTALEPATAALLQRMLCPLTGLAQEIGFAQRGRLEPRIAVSGGDMTGVHVLRGKHAPREGAYHIGGSGLTYGEVVIRTLGETIERYVQFAPDKPRHFLVATLEELLAEERTVAVTDPLRFFSEAQLGRDGFPFSAVSDETRIGWVAAPSAFDGTECWVPAQQALVGYVPADGEPQYVAGVTTGTAAHTDLAKAARNALLEVVQIDAAVGHWYGAMDAIALGRDARTRALDDLVARQLEPGGPIPRFYLLPSPDLPGFAVACVLESAELPRIAVGLGCDLQLTRAMYKAFLEGAAVAQLAKVNLFRQATSGSIAGSADTDGIYDLDTNVAYYAVHLEAEALTDRFGNRQPVSPTELPADSDGSVDEDLSTLIAAFRKSGKRLVLFDLSTNDIRELGFRVVRVWSPDVLPLPLPSTPMVEHPRFLAYGGVTHEAPHPYP